MKENINIDQLFQKAAQTPMHTSFDEAKENFTTSLGRRDASRWKILRSKNWIIMISILIGAAAAGALTFGSNTIETSHKNHIASIAIVPKSTKTQFNQTERNVYSDNGPTVAQLEVMNPSILDSFIPMTPVAQSVYLLEPNLAQIVRYNDENKYLYDFASDRRNKEEDSLEIPVLTEEEISDNEKRKKKMMKLLAKRHKDHYAYVPSGSTTYKGKAYSVQAFFMQVNEVTNIQYRTFLNDLLIQGREEDYKKAVIQNYQWQKRIDLLYGGSSDMSAMVNLYHWHPAYDNYPVVNVTREGAEMYCVWLTQETNNSKYMENQIPLNDLRLPQRAEWTYAASNGNGKYVYPWGGPSTQNAQACYLANYKPEKDSFHADGAFHTAKTGTYNPNDFGLYNMSGNVAEMVYGATEFDWESDLLEVESAPGTAGGGWMDDAETLKIEGDDPYAGETEGHPNIGFRVVITYIGGPQ